MNPENQLHDTFRGDDKSLIASIEALIALDAEGALRPHGLGGHARDLLSAAAVRLRAQGARVPDDGLISKDRFYGDDHIQDIAHALAQECEAAELDPNDLVTVNREKLIAIAKRVLEKASAALSSSPTAPQADNATQHSEGAKP